jgi:hypothetical protein
VRRLFYEATANKEDTMPKTFTVIDDFHSEEFHSDYVAGLSYTAQDHDEKLLELIPKWLKEGKIREGGPVAEVTGTGEITEEKE